MAKPQKLPFPQLLRAFWNPYLRQLVYLKPYRNLYELQFHHHGNAATGDFEA